MLFVASVPDTSFIPAALACGADIIEVRLDLSGTFSQEEAGVAFGDVPVPLIFTVRSAAEGGKFSGDPDDWWETLRPCLPYATYVDVERAFRSFAPDLRKSGKTVIASFHTASMPDAGSLEALRRDLASFGDIPKIVVGPDSESERWAKRAAELLNSEYDVLEKHRISPKEIEIRPKTLDVKGRDVLIIDDIVSTGGTIAEAIKLLKAQGVRDVYVACVHGVFVQTPYLKLHDAGVRDILATDTLEKAISKVSVAPVIAAALHK